jgi:hypothetical protein
MNEFFRFFEEIRHKSAMHLEIYFSKITSWNINVYKKGCADDGGDLNVVHIWDTDMNVAFAKAYISLRDWLLDNEGGY